VAGPRVRNSLPPELRMLNCTVCTFAAKLRTFYFRLSARLRTFEAALYKSAHYITLHRSMSGAGSAIGVRTAAKLTLPSIDGTDGRRPARYMDPAPHAMRLQRQ